MEMMKNNEKQWKTMENDDKDEKSASPAVHHMRCITCNVFYVSHAWCLDRV